MKYVVGGFTDTEENLTIIDKAPEVEYRELNGKGEYVQADIREPLPELPPGEYIHIGRVLRYLSNDSGHHEGDEVNVPLITKAILNVLALAKQNCQVELIDHPDILLPAVATLGSEGFQLELVELLEYADEDFPAEYHLTLTRRNK